MTSGNGEERIEFYWQQEKQTVDISVPISVGDEAVAEMRKAKKIEIDAGMNWGIPHAYAVIFDDESECPFVVGRYPYGFPEGHRAGLGLQSRTR